MKQAGELDLLHPEEGSSPRRELLSKSRRPVQLGRERGGRER